MFLDVSFGQSVPRSVHPSVYPILLWNNEYEKERKKKERERERERDRERQRETERERGREHFFYFNHFPTFFWQFSGII